MSKILDLLNYNRWDKKGDAPGKTDSNESPRNITPQGFDPDTREKLANTYIFNPIEKPKESAPKPVKKMKPREHKKADAHVSFRRVFPWVITFLAVLLLLANIAFRGKIIVNIDFVSEASPRVAEVAPRIYDRPIDNAPKAEAYRPAEQITHPGSIALTGRGEPNHDIVKRIGFYGAALSKSKLLNGGFLLFNDGTAGYASTGFDFTHPMDLSDSTLDFFIKGSYGNESLKLFLRDANSNSYLPQATNLIFKKNMGKDWQFVSVPFGNFAGSYDAKAIKHIGFEFGTQTTQNEPGSSIYIKNIRIVDKSP